MRISFRNLNFRMKEIGIPVRYPAGEKIILRGHKNRFFFLVADGLVEVYSGDGGRKIHLARLFPGDYFGEMSCLTGEASSATYAALDDVDLLRTDREGLLKLLADLPEFNRHILETFCSMVKKGGTGPEAAVPLFSAGDGAGDSRPRDAGSAGRPRIGLALGAGVVRGMAHIGVIRSLQKNGIPVDMVAGTSAGAMVGACLAAGLTVDRMEEIAKGLRWSRIAAPVLPPGKAFLNNEKLGLLVERELGGKTFSELKIPFAVVAADACTGEEVVIREGKVSDAVRASTAIPAVFDPVKLGDRTLIDGAVVNMVPASVCRSMGADLVIAVSVNDFSFRSGPPRNIIMAILRYTDMMLKRQVAQAKNQWADIVVSVERPDLSGYSFREARQFIREGERAADSAMPRIKALISAWRI
ncbi:MAG: patatin-like phospholipase family protein [Peptococcaceae bacterium]|nr:patatin-like phospholipase family protein [Peptococcaceae bacterium]